MGQGRAGALSRAGAPGPADEAELEALLHLRLLPRVGDLVAHRLFQRLGSARAVLEASDEVLGRLTGPATVAARARAGDEPARRAREVLDRARSLGITVLGRGLPGYPACLLHLADPPPVLFLEGRLELLDAERVAVVGTRRATGAGRRFATRLGRVISDEGVAVVSGLALGVDGAAHRGALAGPGSTVAVLGSGLARSHPRSHARLQARIAEEGLLVSEFPPDEAAAPHHFPRRNRILAALSRAVVVVEAGARSGALITADHALDIGREVLAVPGSVEYEQSKGTNALIRDGAAALIRPDQFRDEWRRMVFEADGSVPPPPATERARAPVERPPDPEGVLPLLGDRPRSADELARTLDRPPSRILGALSELELAGAAVLDGPGWRAARKEDDPQPKRRAIPRRER